MKIYLVTSGEYSGYHVDAVFTTRALAEAYVGEAARCGLLGYDPDIGEWEADEEAGKVSRTVYCALIRLKDGQIINEIEDLRLVKPQERSLPVHSSFEDGHGQTVGYQAESLVSAEHARKLAVEYRQKWLREQGNA